MLLLILCAIVSIAVSQEITTNSCSVSKGCVKMPPSCTSSTNCDFLVTYRRKPSDSNIMEFEVSSRLGGGWIALGFNPNTAMAGTRGEICYLSGGSGVFQGFHATGYFTPPFQTPATGTVLSGVSLVNGAIVCRFSRPVLPFAYQGSLGPAIYPVIATGAVANGSPARHLSRVVGNLVDLLAFTAQQTTTKITSTAAATTKAATTTTTSMKTTTLVSNTDMTSTTTSMTTTNANEATSMSAAGQTTPTKATSTYKMTSSEGSSSSMQSGTGTMMSVTTTTNMQKHNSTQRNMATTTYAPMNQMIDLTSCGKEKGCYRVPSGCQINLCKFVATWKPDIMKKYVEIELYSKARGWVAFGLNKEPNKMAGTYGEICYRDGSSTIVKAFHARARITPTFSNIDGWKVNKTQVMMSNGALTCRYTRTFAAISNLAFDINQDLYITVASGDSISPGGVPTYHGANRYSSTMKYNIAAALKMSGNKNNKKKPTGMASRMSSSALVLILLGFISILAQYL